MSERDFLESDALRSFAVFAEHRNFTAAAAALHISQPSLHVKIKKLAAALGTELYERDGRRLRLTASGEQLAAFALDSQRRVDDFLREIGTAAPTSTIAAGRGTIRWVITDAIKQLDRQGHKVRIITADRDAAQAALMAGRADVAVLAYDPPPSHVSTVQIASYPQMLVIGSEHRLATRDTVQLGDLDGLELVVPPVGRAHRRALDRALLDAGVSCEVAAEVDGWDLLVHLVGLGIGATIVNSCVQLPAGLSGVPVIDLPTVRYWATWRTQRHGAVRYILDQFRRP
jgi:DNA-binding transcriptional LysR family regulator